MEPSISDNKDTDVKAKGIERKQEVSEYKLSLKDVKFAYARAEGMP